MKTKIIIIAGVIILVVASVFCLFCKDDCNSGSCKSKSKTEHSADCDSCGKNSCGKSCSSNPSGSNKSLKSLVPSCNLSEDEMGKRKEFLQATIAKKIHKVEEIENGYDLIFKQPKEFSVELLEFINFERNCCSSFSFALIFEPNNEATHLQMYGSKEIKAELKRGFIEAGFLKNHNENSQ